MNLNCSNLFKDATTPKIGESFETLLQRKNVTIKRIISSSHIDSEVMSQEEDEWFIMIEGSATIMIGDEKRALVQGDYCFIEAKKEHRLLSVSAGTVWLAIHIM